MVSMLHVELASPSLLSREFRGPKFLGASMDQPFLAADPAIRAAELVQSTLIPLKGTPKAPDALPREAHRKVSSL